MLTIVDFAAAAELGVRHTFGEKITPRYDVLAGFFQRAAEGKLTVPIAATFALDDWRKALDISSSGRARGKLVLVLR